MSALWSGHRIGGALLLLVLGRSLPGWAQIPAVPISANSPHVVLGLTNQRNSDDTDFFSVLGAPNNNALPIGGTPHYEIAILDTGAPAVILGPKATEAFDLGSAGREGTVLAPIAGITDSYNSDPIGNFIAGLDAIQSVSAGGDLRVDRSRLQGSYNDSVIYAGPGDQLPTLVGTTITGRYTTTINYGTPKLIEVNGRMVRSPAVELHELGSVNRPARRLGLTLADGGLGPIPTFLPNLEEFDINDLGNNPSFPTIAGSFFLNANVKNNGVERNQLQMFLDTGSQATIVSEQIASEMGFDVSLDAPDFVVRIQGVTETFEDVPGFYADEFQLPGTGGGLVLKNVPLVVFNFPDPRSPNNTLPGIIGMNLFHDRDLILSPESGAPYLGVSDSKFEQHRWAATTPDANWETPAAWSNEGTPSITWQALLMNGSGSSQVARVNTDTTIASVQVSGASDSTTSMMVDIAAGKTLEVFGNVILEDRGGIHLQRDARLAPLAVEIRGGKLSGTGIVEGEVLSQGILAPGDADVTGTMTFTGSMDQLNRGTIELDLADAATSDRIDVELDSLLDGHLALRSLPSMRDHAADSTEVYTLISARKIFGEFDQVTFDGLSLARTGPRLFRGPNGSGQWGTIRVRQVNNTDQVQLSMYQAIAGDVDGNGDVSFQDFLILSQHFSQGGNWLNGDLDGTKQVDFADFLILSENYGRKGVGANLAVPEPGIGGIFMLTGLCGYLRLVRERRSRGIV